MADSRITFTAGVLANAHSAHSAGSDQSSERREPRAVRDGLESEGNDGVNGDGDGDGDGDGHCSGICSGNAWSMLEALSSLFQRACAALTALSWLVDLFVFALLNSCSSRLLSHAPSIMLKNASSTGLAMLQALGDSFVILARMASLSGGGPFRQ